MKKINIKLLLILLLGFILRLYGINWDQGFHLHPDERMLIMVADRINFFNQLNPNFFNYGSLPIYLLKGISQLLDFLFNTNLGNYQNMLYVGRSLSIFSDLITIFLIYRITYLIFSKSVTNKSSLLLLPSLLYALAFFPIQNSHFFTVDIFLTLFTTLLLYRLLTFCENVSMPRPRLRYANVIFIGLVFSAMVTTKFTAIIYYPLIFLIIIIKNKLNKHLFKEHLLINLIIFNFSFLIFNFLLMPYAFLEYKRFISDITAQMRMSSNAYIFPYTLQYLGTIPYLYYLKNIFLWGLGPITSILSLVGLIYLCKSFLSYKLRVMSYKPIILFIFYLFYFLIIGRSAVKFMRYMLPLYPFFTILAGYGLYQIKISKLKIQNHKSKFNNFTSGFNFLIVIFTFSLLIFNFVWTLMFVNIYSKEHTRISATKWILKNIPTGLTLATEHWDDLVPLYESQRYNIISLPLYDLPDNKNKWIDINEKLNVSDYIIITSNRLYVPLQKLSDCSKYKLCYPKTAEYYQKLFDSFHDRNITFQKVSEFTVYPEFQILNFKFQIDDSSADESFTVYDHPKIMIFKKK